MTNHDGTIIRQLTAAGALVALTAAVAAQGLSAQGRGSARTVSPVYSTWDSSTVLGSSGLVRTAEAISAALHTSSLPPGQAITLWFGVFNNPAACATSPCTLADVGNPAVRADFLWGGGHIVGNSGLGTFAGRLPVGDASGSVFIEFGMPGAAIGLEDPWGAEVWLLLHSHGPALSGQALKHQLTSFLGGCFVFLGGADGFADGPGDIPTSVGECVTFHGSSHQ